MKESKQRKEERGNRYLLMEKRLMQKYNSTDAASTANAQISILSDSPSLDRKPLNGNDDISPPNNNPPTLDIPATAGEPMASGQSRFIVRAFACDDGAPIHLQYDANAFRERKQAFPVEKSRPSAFGSNSLPHHFETFEDAPNSITAPSHLPTPHSPTENKGTKRNGNGAVSPPSPETALPKSGNTGPSSRNPLPQSVSRAAPVISNTPPSSAPAANSPTLTPPTSSQPNWDVLDNAPQQIAEAQSEDRFVSDLQSLLREARNRVEKGQATPSLSPNPAGTNSVTPEKRAPTPSPTASSPAAQEQIDGKVAELTSRHSVFDQLGQQMNRAVTFDMGTISVDKTFASIEASIDAEATAGRAQRKSVQAKPLKPIEAVEDMALITAPRVRTLHSVPQATISASMTRQSSLETHMMSSDIPLDPGVGGRSIPVEVLTIGDLVVSTTNEVPSRLIRFGTQAPVSHAMLYIGDGLVVEAIGSGVVQRTVADAIAGSYLAVAFRHPGLTPEQALIARDYAGNQLGREYNYIGILRHAGFQLDRLIFCSGKTGDDYDRCIRWTGRVNLGTATNDRFFCSELVLKSYEAAGVPLTATAPQYTSPGVIAELAQQGMLAYVGHLKYEV